VLEGIEQRGEVDQGADVVRVEQEQGRHAAMIGGWPSGPPPNPRQVFASTFSVIAGRTFSP